MVIRKIIYFFLFFNAFSLGSKSNSLQPSFLIKLVNHNQARSLRNIGNGRRLMGVSQTDLNCKYKCMTANELAPKFMSRVQARFIDQGSNDSVNDTEMEAPAAKFSIFNLLSDEEEGDEGVKEDEDDSVDHDFNFFDSEEEEVKNVNNLGGTKDESLLKQYHRNPLRMHNLVFPLLLAYKLKFFTVIPLLLGSLVLLVGTTGVAGFFFALFAAALAIHSKTQEHV